MKRPETPYLESWQTTQVRKPNQEKHAYDARIALRPNRDSLTENAFFTNIGEALISSRVRNSAESPLLRSKAPALGRWVSPRKDAQAKAGLNAYVFVNNQPIIAYDFLGLDITLETGNDSGYVANDSVHQNVCVNFGGQSEKLFVSFAMFRAGIHIGRKWLGWNSPTCAILEGEIYITNPVPGAAIINRHTTTHAQDNRCWDYIVKYRVSLKDGYSVERHNCRKYSQWEFRDAPLHW